MKNLWRMSFGTSLIAVALLVLPMVVSAEAAVVSITPSATDISSEFSMTPPNGTSMFTFAGTDDQDYTAVFSVDECPVVLLTFGATMSEVSNWSCDATALQVTANFTTTGFVEGSFDYPVGDGLVPFMVAMTPAAEVEGTGPSASEAGMWMSTDVMEWEMTPPSPDNIAFGYSLTGPSGETGFFKMFIPQGTIDLLSYYSGETLTVSDLAVFDGDSQSSMSVSEVTGGGLVDINVTFSNTVTASSAMKQDDNSTVTKTITAGEQLPLSLAARKTQIKKGKQTKLYGNVKGVGAKQKVKIFRAYKTKNLKIWRTVITNKNGYFSTWVKSMKSPMKYKAKATVSDEKRTSSIVTISRK